MYIALRIVRGLYAFIFASQVLGLLPVFSWLQDPSAITVQMFVVLLVKILALILFGALFFGLRKFINWLHMRRHAQQHPALIKAWSL